jgi:hypothetical protein
MKIMVSEAIGVINAMANICTLGGVLAMVIVNAMIMATKKT